ncbi:ATP-binding protein [uncultured Sphingomonas sp.]|uniref:chemotaxis protein CheA n=1 Tax=uncultured Sphingomonas sp. TaxID=158754 RepID=UPI0025DACD34|nr:ATP-binding protein [uncultured Sphingomonas sp.]
MDELLEQFLIEGRELVAEAQAALGLLAVHPGDATAIDRLFRAVHTLKGSVAIFDMKPAERILHAAEDVLSAARKASRPLAGGQVAAVLACVDQVDRWIDAMEQGGEVPASMEVAQHLLAALRGEDAAPAPRSWLDMLREREAPTVAAVAGSLTAFRYRPDAQCFFRGDDPLALVAAMPGLLRLAVLPAEPWPTLDTWDPFRCVMALEGISTAAAEEVRAAFRFVPDQISIATIDPPSSPAVPAPPTPAPSARTIRVDGTRLDRLSEEVGELVTAANALTALAAEAERADPELAAAIRLSHAGLDRALGRLRRSATALRLVTLGTGLQRLPRLARQIADELGKPVRFTVQGEGLEVDKDIADGVFEPLLHLLRNAIDHGIEPPSVRAAAGKPAEARVGLTATPRGGEVAITLADDGRGIDPDRIRRVAAERGLLSLDAAAALSDTEARGLIFAPGFSTASDVTDISGRGVGMDSVRATVDRLGGRLEVDSTVGQGTRITLRFPVHAVTTRLLIVRAGSERYGIAFDQIRQVVRIGRDRLTDVGAGRACVLRDRTVPVLGLAEALGGTGAGADPLRLLVTDTADGPIAWEVDGLEQVVESIVRPRGGLLSGALYVAGTTLLADGGVLLVLDLAELVG